MRFFRSRARPFPGAAVYIGTACVQDTIITVRMKYSRHSPIVRAVFSTGLRKCMRLLVRYVYQEHTQMTIQLTTCHSALRHGFRRMSSSSFGIHVISRDCRPNQPNVHIIIIISSSVLTHLLCVLLDSLIYVCSCMKLCCVRPTT